MKIKINSTPEGVIVRNQNFDKLGKTPFEIEKNDFLGQRLFLNYDGIIKEFVVDETLVDINESFLKTIENNELSSANVEFSNSDEIGGSSSLNLKFILGGITLIVVLVGVVYWYFSSKPNEVRESFNNEVVKIDSVQKPDLDNSVEFTDNKTVVSESKLPIEKTTTKEEKKEEVKSIESEKKPIETKSKFSDSQANVIINKSISFENNKNANGLSDLFATKILRYKSKNNISKTQIKSIYNEWWNSLVYEEKQVSSITPLGDNSYRVKINHSFQVDGGNEKNVFYYGIYKFDKSGKITELYVD
ncbi:hypothetical protein ACTS9T_03610 [Empedobacter falsenii]